MRTTSLVAMVLPDDRPSQVVRREQLLRVARTIFAEKGFQATTMDDIAKEAGFTTGAAARTPLLGAHSARTKALPAGLLAA